MILLQINKLSSKEINTNRDDLNIHTIEVCVGGRDRMVGQLWGVTRKSMGKQG